ncbi:hypothetical protein A0J61_01301 [Choanephora cucurbitarum]|uniref:Uncharacterized protein n=1 Tax=Choanephora cucurbitarum TaxID=101091 RepID=A0A1C7NND1_9FUNG|nr:hypothetical protein A0J61_01301 [Choanephora cucurbitarum]
MNVDDYQTAYEGKDKYLLYFSQAPLKFWKYHDFERHFQALPIPTSKKTLISSYKLCLAQIKDNKKTPPYVKEKIKTLLEDLTTDPSSACASTTYHINQGPSSVINYGSNNTISTSTSDIITKKQNSNSSISKHKRAFGDVDDEQQFVQKRKQDTPVRPVDFIFSEETNSIPVPSPMPAEFRKGVYAYGVKALSKDFFVEDSFNLQQLIDSFLPRTPGEQLDMMSAKLTMSIDLNNIIQVNALKLSLSRTVDFVNGKIASLFRQYLDDTFWKELSKVNITLCAGMPATSKNLYQAMMAEGSNNGKLNRKQLRVAVAKKKLSLLESNQTDSLQVLDIIDLLAKHCLSDSAILPNNTESELTTYRKFAKILDEILDDTMLDMLDGESTCKASKSIAKTHEKIYDSNIPLNNGFGRRIDLILATKNLELSTSEWKRDKTSPAKCLQQQSKNIRMNKAILTHLLGLPFNEADSDRVFTVGMDWTGPMGYMFAIKQVKDIYVAKPISTLLMPSYLEELPSFEETLNCLYAWRNHHLSLKETMLPALRKCEQGMFFSSVLGTSVSEDTNSSPNIYLTPSRRRRGQIPATTDLDLEDLSNDEQ